MRFMFFCAIVWAACCCNAAEPSPSDPLWDGRESVAEYAQRAHLDSTKTLDLGNGIKLELLLIPAGKFIMGTPEPEKPTITVFSAQVLIGIGAALALALLAYIFLRKRTGRRFSFSLRWLMAFSFACSIMVWGGTRWYLARVQLREYEAAMVRYNAAYANEKPAHPVLISKAFYMGKYAVTQAQYEAVTGANPSQFKGPQNPVETVSWDEAAAFCKQLNERLRTQALEARLPTEAQWEYACRAGTKTRFYSGDADSDLDAVAWYEGNSKNTTHPVGTKKPNAFGLYDMHGNVWQWCQDAYKEDYEKLNATDPVNDVQGAARVLRGGSCYNIPEYCRSAYRYGYGPDDRGSRLGFRVVLVPSSRTPH
ncbi:MAG: formylglycine-generating enzyme family protein [Planctomycetota bacterium]